MTLSDAVRFYRSKYSSSWQAKWIHVEPYWRGPEEGAVAVRPHVVVEKA